MKKGVVGVIGSAAVAALASGSVFAQQAGDWVVGAGWVHVAPQEESQPLRVTATGRPTVTLLGSGASVSNADTLGMHATYFINSNWAVEGVLGVPPKFRLDGEGTLAGIGELGQARQWSPVVLAKYYFGSGAAAFRPYVGLGATYVWYSDVNLTSGLQGALNQRLGAPPGATRTSGKLDSSLAPVVNVGAAYQFDQHWGLALSLSYIPLKTTAKLTTTLAANGAQVASSESKIKLDPIVTYLALTYRF